MIRKWIACLALLGVQVMSPVSVAQTVGGQSPSPGPVITIIGPKGLSITCGKVSDGVGSDCFVPASIERRFNELQRQALKKFLESHTILYPGKPSGQDIELATDINLMLAPDGHEYVATTATGALPASEGARLFDPHWIVGPANLNYMTFYPDRDLRLAARGQVILTCFVGADAKLTSCWIKEEFPTGHGFGGHAVVFVENLKMSEQSLSGKSVFGRFVVMVVHFNGTSISLDTK